MLLATDHVWNASRLVFAVNLCVQCMPASVLRMDCSVAAVNVAGDDVAGDGLSGHGGNVGLLPDAKS